MKILVVYLYGATGFAAFLVLMVVRVIADISFRLPLDEIVMTTDPSIALIAMNTKCNYYDRL